MLIEINTENAIQGMLLGGKNGFYSCKNSAQTCIMPKAEGQNARKYVNRTVLLLLEL